MCVWSWQDPVVAVLGEKALWGVGCGVLDRAVKNLPVA